jgi:hypothetical protein
MGSWIAGTLSFAPTQKAVILEEKWQSMSKEFDAVEMVRRIRDDIYEKTKEMSVAELVEYFRLHGASARDRLALVESRHELVAPTRE